MRVLIISSTCSSDKYKEICNKRTIKSLDTNQKFFSSIISGFKHNKCSDITCISVLPVSFRTFPERFVKQENKVCDGVKYIYCKTLNYPFIRTLYASFQVKKLVKQYIKKNHENEVLIITDGLFFEFSKACRFLHRKEIKVFTIVTDIPDFLSNTNNVKSIKGLLLKKYCEKATNALKNNYDGYVFLTEQMNDICNINNKPYMVVEGLLSDHERKEKTINYNEQLPIVMYAGKYNKEFGSLLLANAAVYLKGICNIVMYGSGEDCIGKLKEIEHINDNLIVNDIIPLERLLELETEVDLLINPRPSGQNFTKYSFPSKTLEYMDSGTPVLMYKLEGIPKEYDDYLYYIKGDTSRDIAESIKQVLSNGKEDMFNRGNMGKKFVRENKNCDIQSKKILDFIRKYVNEENSCNKFI